MTDFIGAPDRNGRRRERNIGIAHEQVVVFNRDGPVRRKTDFKSRPHGATPTGVACLIERDSACGKEAVVFVGGDRGAALQIPENIVPGVTDLAGEQAESIGLGLIGVGNQCRQARILSGQVSPVTLRFDAEHKI